MANAPSSGTGWESLRSDLPDGESEILPVGLFCRRGGNHPENVGYGQIYQRHCERSEAIHSHQAKKEWIASLRPQ
jgi:hypothetical protein